MVFLDLLELFAAVALGLAGVSGILLTFTRRNVGTLNALYRARILLLFQLTIAVLVLGVLPMVIRAEHVGEVENLRLSSAVMVGVVLAAMALARWTYRRSRAEFADAITRARQLTFHGLLALQVLLAAGVALDLFRAAASTIYLWGLAVMLGLSIYQLMLFLSLERTDGDNGAAR